MQPFHSWWPLDSRAFFRLLWTSGLALLCLIALSGPARAAGLDLQFTGGVNVTGGACALTLNTRCRFNNVIVGEAAGSSLQRDIIVTVSDLVNATLDTTVDNAGPTLSGTAPVASANQFLAPTVRPTQTTANVTGWAGFTFDVVRSGGPVPAVGTSTTTLPGTFWVTSFDTDGDGGTLREFVEFVGASATGLSAGTTLTASTAVAGGTQYQGATAGQANISTGDPYKGSAFYTAASSFRLIYGARTGTSGSTAGGRLTAFDFFRPDAVLRQPLLDGFKSVRLTTDTDGSGDISAGDTLTYTVVYTNTGNAAASSFQISDPLPAGLTITATGGQAVWIDGTQNAAARNVGYTGGAGAVGNLLATGQTLAAGGSIRVDIPVRVGTVTASTTLNNQASATATGVSAVLSDNVDESTAFVSSVRSTTGWPGVPAGSVTQNQTAALSPTAVLVELSRADLTLSKSNGVNGLAGPSVTTYTIVLTNNGPASANGTVLRDLAAPGLTKTAVSCASSSGAVCPAVTTATLESGVTVPTLPAGGRITLTLTASVTATSGSVANSVTATLPSGTVDPSPTGTVTDTDSVNSADLAVAKTGPATAPQGNTFSYVIRAWNNGVLPVSAATLADPVPANVTGVSWTCVGSGGATCASASGTGNSVSVTVNLPVDGGSATTPDTDYVTLTVTGRATTGGIVTNRATVSPPASITDSVTTNNSSAVDTAIVAQVTCPNLYATTGGDFTTNNNGTEIRSLNDTTNTLGNVVTLIPATLEATPRPGYTATLALTPDRSRFFVVRDVDTRLLIFDVASSTWQEGPTLPTTTGRYVRMAITSTGIGYVMDGGGNLYRFATTSPYTVSSAIPLTVVPATAPTVGPSGDFFADDRGNLFLLSSQADGQLDFWEVEPNTGQMIYLGRLSDADIIGGYGGFASTPNGLFGRGGSGRMISVDLQAFTATPVGSASSGSTDLTSCSFPTFNRTVTATKAARKVAGSAGTLVRPGDTLEYRIVVRNSGSIAAGNTKFSDQIPAGTTYVPGSTLLNGILVSDAAGGGMPYAPAPQLISSAGQPSGTLLVDVTPANDSDREAVIVFQVRVNTSPEPTQVSNQGITTYRDNGSDLTVLTDDPATPASNDATVTRMAAPDVTVTKTGPAFAQPADPAKPDQSIIYTLVVSNVGDKDAGSVTVRDVLPTGLTFKSASAGGTYVVGTRTVTWTLPALIAGGAQTLTVEVTAPTAAQIQGSSGVKQVSNTAAVSTAGDTVPGNDTSATVNTAFILPVLAKDVRNVTKNSLFGTSGGGLPGEVLEYCIDFRNEGGAALPNFVLVDHVPGNTNALITAYDADEPSAATGFGVKLTRGAVTSYLSSSAADADGGRLTTTGGTFSRGTMTVTLGTLAVGESGRACFQTTIR
nr:isopeptide-forming domain-containing fimbrial protein [Deinococcus sp. 12RED42]